MKHGEEPASPHLSCPQYIHPLMNRSARPRAHWRWRPLLPPKKTDANATFHFLRENRHQGSIKTNVSGGEGMGASCAGNLGREALSSKSSPPFPQ